MSLTGVCCTKKTTTMEFATAATSSKPDPYEEFDSFFQSSTAMTSIYDEIHIPETQGKINTKECPAYMVSTSKL